MFSFLTPLMALFIFALASCTSVPTLPPIQSSQRADGARIVGLVGDASAPWMDNVEQSVRQRGFDTKRYLAGEELRFAEGDGIRYVLYVNAAYSFRCLPGGFWFTSYDAKLVNLRTTVTISAISTSGLSENCVPGGSVFATTGAMVDRSWSNQPLVTEEQVRFQACFDKLASDAGLAGIKDKVALTTVQDQTFSMLANNTKPNSQDKPILKKWGEKRDVCMKMRREALAAARTPLIIANVIESTDAASQAQLAELYNGNITYATFAVKRRDLATSSNDAIARIDVELHKQTEDSRFKANQIAIEAQRNALMHQKIVTDMVMQQQQINVQQQQVNAQRLNAGVRQTTNCSVMGSNINCYSW